MTLFNKLGEKINGIGKDISTKTKNYTNLARINTQIQSEEENIVRLYTEIGKVYYDLKIDHTNELLFALCSEISDSFENLESLKKQIKNMKGYTNCSACGNEVTVNTRYCNICGSKILISEYEEEEPDQRCPNCKMPYHEDTYFCTNCGTKVK